MFITNISPMLTFGHSYSKATNNAIGAIETILATCLAGCAFTLFGGMPPVIVGSTGPVVIMTTTIYNMMQSLNIPFLPFYAWVSVWIQHGQWYAWVPLVGFQYRALHCPLEQLG